MRFEPYILKAIECNASDVHIAPNAVPMFRINGQLKPVESEDVLTHDTVYEGVKHLCDSKQWMKLEEKGEVNFSLSIPDSGRFRVNIIKQRSTYSVTIRILKRTIPNREGLDLPPVLFDLAASGRGLIIISGASGSGRSTTMAALIQYLNETQSLNMITVESSIEYLFRNDRALVLQRDVGTDCETLLDGVKNIMRHDPDVVMISDVSDPDVLELSLQIAESGKLVIVGLTSINTVTTLETVLSSADREKLENRRVKLASNLVAVLSQQLVPARNEESRKLVYELLIPNAVIQSHILSNTLSEIRNTLVVGKKQGMVSMDANLFERYQRGDIDQDAVYKYCQDAEYIRRLERNLQRGDA